MTPVDGATSDWLQHGFTSKLRKHLQEQHELAFKKLLAVCRKSDDPVVTREFAVYEEIGSFLDQLGKANAHGRDDGDDD